MRIAPHARRLAAAAVAGGTLVATLAAAPALAHTRVDQCVRDGAQLDQSATWTEAERWVWQQACARQPALFEFEYERFGDTVDDDRRRVSATFLRTILTEEPFRTWLEGHPLRLRGARLHQGLHLRDETLPGALFVEYSLIEGGIDLSGATVPGNLLVETIGGSADGVAVSLRGARVAGSVGIFDSSRLAGTDVGIDDAMPMSAALDGARIDGDVVLFGRLGDVGANGATVGGTFDGSLTDYDSLTLDAAEVTGPVLLDNSTFEGSVNLQHAAVGDDVSAVGSVVGGGVILDSAEVEGSVQITETLVEGRLDFDNVRIGRDLRLNRSEFRATVDLAKARIGVDVLADCSAFQDPTSEDGEPVPVGLPRRGLRLDQAPPSGACTFGHHLLLSGASIGGEFSAERGVTIGGSLMLEGASVGRSVSIGEAAINGRVVLENATVGDEVNFAKATVHGGSGGIGESTGEVSCGTSAAAHMSLVNATVGDDVRGMRSNIGALHLIAAEVGGSVALGGDVGSICLMNAGVDGDVRIEGALRYLELIAATVAGDVDVFVGSGEAGEAAEPGVVVMDNAAVGGDVTFGGPFELGQLFGADVRGGITARATFGGGLSLDSASVDRDVELRGTFRCGVRLANVEIGGDIDATGSEFDVAGDCSPQALLLDGARVGGDVNLSSAAVARAGDLLTSGGDAAPVPGFTGPVTIDGSRIAGDLDLTGTFHDDVSLSGSDVAGVVRFCTETATATWHGVLDLRDTDVGGIVELSHGQDALSAWPEVRLTGFSYGPTTDRCGEDDVGSSSSDLSAAGVLAAPGGDRRDEPRARESFLGHGAEWYEAWLEKEPDFARAPYRALEAALRDAGRANVAESVAMARRDRALAQVGVAWWEQELGRLHRWTVGYGYKPEWSIRSIIVLVLVGWAMAGLMKQYGGCPQIRSPFLFSFDRLLPGKPLDQAKAVNLARMTWPFKVYFFFHMFAGYALATALVAAFTGLTGG